MERVRVRNWENGNFNFNFVQYQVNQGKLVSIYKVEKSEWSLEVKRIKDRVNSLSLSGTQCTVHCSSMRWRLIVIHITHHIRLRLITLTIMIMIDFTPRHQHSHKLITRCNDNDVCNDFSDNSFPRHKSFVSQCSRITFVCKQSGLNDPVSIKWSPGTISNFYASHCPQDEIRPERRDSQPLLYPPNTSTLQGYRLLKTGNEVKM